MTAEFAIDLIENILWLDDLRASLYQRRQATADRDPSPVRTQAVSRN
jgi:hypothetical protein